MAPAARAQVRLPAVNLGDTSFEDGIAFPGVLVEEILGYATSDEYRDAHGNKVPGSNSATIVNGVTHVAWISEWQLLGANYGAEVLLPFADLDVRTSFGPNGRERGLGDITVSPLVLQWGATKVFGMPLFQLRPRRRATDRLVQRESRRESRREHVHGEPVLRVHATAS